MKSRGVRSGWSLWRVGVLLAWCVGWLSLPTHATDAPSLAQAAFARLKTLNGEWQGKIGERENGPPVTVRYRTTAAGNTVMEPSSPARRMR